MNIPKRRIKFKTKSFVSKRQLYRRAENDVNEIIGSQNKVSKSEVCQENVPCTSTSTFPNVATEGSNVKSSNQEVLTLSSDEISDDSNVSDISNDCNTFENMDHLSPATTSKENKILNSITSAIRTWAVTNPSVPHTAITSLLHILAPFHPELPLDSRTLLKTPSKFNIRKLENGDLIYLGIQNSLHALLSIHSNNFLDDTINLIFNVDGLPIFKSSNMQLWPILGLIQNFNVKTPFPIAIFCGVSKPKLLNDYLEDFIKELTSLLQNGFNFNSKSFKVSVNCFVCDAPARSYLKCIKSHGGYSSCEKCTVAGTYYKGRVILNDINADLRTDESFRLKLDEDHHLNDSPLLQLNIGLVTSFPIDYMHNVCLGVTRKLLNCWISGIYRVRLPSRSVEILSDKMVHLKNCIPTEINRKPRSLSELARFKATEFRTFLLYLGPVILPGIINISVHEHFLLLHAAIVILCSEKHIRDFGCEAAYELLKNFVQHSEQIYDAEFLIFNVHNLIHLPTDVAIYGALDNFSAFPFENFLGQLKRLIKSPKQPLIQICNRLQELNFLINDGKTSNFVNGKPQIEHFCGPVLSLMLQLRYKQFKKVYFKNYQFSVTSLSNADSYCMIKEKVIQIHNFICYSDGSLVIIGKMFSSYSCLYDYPFSSSSLNIHVVDKLSELQSWPLSNVNGKCIVFPYKDHRFVSMPLLHTL
ncbi:hypothetical protein PPYR_09371 [Photinus pyralis]|uniref:Transposase domain-containing protein n=1 Tax=Photinus pyralis TaxID=7054 RepID=A0A1Y1L9W2_PHOPY|nr:uncharacterized protein LOC116172343 isoform X1 [Photinus pyralis]XP_031345407.1 uncharacterized protein LOC116172343 isoform X1 [Photinus pyralis]XP_031357877.1 uncharacterized protein LOC116181636 isoform X1 [Photinus pyralis]XP_031357879.1 uncharacterized protein LOC116181636 isoform X1 [Photinus pyralis]KAB0790671.1 hypothetical protein PPYR_14885 [Photinus pyralis]KAB0798378.1 hypothetical protein PPYR_09371 [Photinus pyralis]